MKHILARHQGLWEQHTSQFDNNGHSQIYDASADLETSLQISDSVYDTYNEFSQNM